MHWKKSIYITTALAAVIIGIRFMGGDRSASKVAPAADNGVPVKIAVATLDDIDLSLTVVARTEAWSTVNVRARVSGQLESLGFKPGAKVHKGELLAQIDPLPFKAQIDQARANVASDQAKLDKAQADLQRYAQVLAKGFVSRTDYDTYKANVEVSHASLQGSIAALELARLQLSYVHIVAPFDGVTGLPQVWPGAQVSANATDIVVLNQIEPIRVTFSLPEGSLDAVRQAQAQSSVPIQAQLPGDGSVALQGTLDFIDNTVDPTTGTIVLKGRFENGDDRLTPGQFLQVKLPTRRLNHVVSVPASALQSSDKGDFVFVVGVDGKAHQRYLAAGPGSAGRIIVNKGLQAGERVVTDGQLLLTDGTAVHASGGV
ncbi:efflux RND transporter periplasmic adaptor subunit [Dyella sp. GSA-30]|uniref:efflux RND transporter periplasmic adaptor subunit n=1 Tax=Dyella sp. GSA-30 TaxID=2994496 RepID=UPI0024905E5A|nr:efflux RND transporter periplasmic adaptor subunit [Dyella sp. GSA-30]BDU21535.1 membrane protein [Dyella sp. GSA-30]